MLCKIEKHFSGVQLQIAQTNSWRNCFIRVKISIVLIDERDNTSNRNSFLCSGMINAFFVVINSFHNNIIKIMNTFVIYQLNIVYQNALKNSSPLKFYNPDPNPIDP